MNAATTTPLQSKFGPIVADAAGTITVQEASDVLDCSRFRVGELLSASAGRVLVSGEVVGNISGTERVELKRTARVFGDVEAPVVILEEGVLFEGHCRMTKVDPNAEATTTRDFSVVPLKR